MLENAKRLQRGLPGCPRVRIEKIEKFLNELGKK